MASICAGVASLITDGITYIRLVHGDNPVSEEYKAVYIVLLCFGVATATVSLAYRLRNARLVQVQLDAAHGRRESADASERNRAISEPRRQVQQHEWELAQTHRTKVTLSLSLLSVVMQGVPLPSANTRTMWPDFRATDSTGLPMSVVNIRLIFIDEVTDKMVRTCLAAGTARPCGLGVASR